MKIDDVFILVEDLESRLVNITKKLSKLSLINFQNC